MLETIITFAGGMVFGALVMLSAVFDSWLELREFLNWRHENRKHKVLEAAAVDNFLDTFNEHRIYSTSKKVEEL